MVDVLRQAMLVFVAGTALGFGANTLSPRPVPLGRPVHAAAESGAGACLVEPASKPAPRIGVAEAATLCSTCAAGFVDARTARDYAAGHVSGAVHLPPAGHPDEASALAHLSTFHTVVVYDGEESCRLAESVARRLAAMGLRDVRVLQGSWQGWVAAGAPGASGACAACQHGPEAHR